ncbi:MAG: hypothetical protein JWP02_3287 [Acidimicrobiales bacterium]|nr:hypothetical protein [Acidimicrobiales bacterium]
MVRRTLLLAALTGLVAAGAASTASAGAPPSAANCPILPADNVWHADISGLPVHARSGAWMGNMSSASTRLHPDFGSSGDPNAPYGIPWTAVPGSHAKVTPAFDYSDESDPGPYPFGPDTPIEGGQSAGGDRHALMLDHDTCVLYELYAANWNGGHPTAGSGAVFDLRRNAPLRPDTWTSADAAGLPILPGLLRLDEVQAGHVDHAIRFTASRTDRSHLWPARHDAGAASDANLPPMGARFRLRANFDMAGYRPDTQVVLRAMQHFGLMLADNGSNWYFQGTAENGWDDGFISDLKRIPASAFEAVDESSLMLDPNSGQYRGGVAGSAPAAPAAPRAAAPRTAVPPATTATTPPVTTAAPTVPPTTVPESTTSSAGPPATSVALGRPSKGTGDPVLLPMVAAMTLAGAAGGVGVMWRRTRALPMET